MLLVRTSERNRSECVDCVLNRSCFVPPSGFKPNPTAIASSSVDLPEPFSPTKNVTGASNASRVRWRIAGTEKGYAVGGAPSEPSRATAWRKIPWTVGANLGRGFFILRTSRKIHALVNARQRPSFKISLGGRRGLRHGGFRRRRPRAPQSRSRHVRVRNRPRSPPCRHAVVNRDARRTPTPRATPRSPRRAQGRNN